MAGLEQRIEEMSAADRIVDWLGDMSSDDGAEEWFDPGASPWPTVGDDEDVSPIDWKRIRGWRSRVPDDDSPDDQQFDDWLISPDELWPHMRDLEGVIGERPVPDRQRDEGPGGMWDRCAWYQPIHSFGHDWGIFIRRDCMIDIGLEVARFLPPGTRPSPALLHNLVLAGFASLFLHEQFHHKVESFALRLEIVEQRPRYLPYQRRVYRRTLGTNDNIEEALANAEAFRRAGSSPYSLMLGPTVLQALKQYLPWRYQFDPPGYNQAHRYFGESSYRAGLSNQKSQVQQAALCASGTARDREWPIASHLHQSLFKVSDHLWEVVPPGGGRPLLPVAPYPSVSTIQLIKLAEKFGWTVKPGTGKGSHVKLTKAGSRPITVPGNRRTLSPGVLRNTLKAIGDYRMNDVPGLLQTI